MKSMHYSAPSLTLKPSSTKISSEIASALILHAGQKAPSDWEAVLPQRLKTHSAWKGELGAQLFVHGKPTFAVFGAGSLEEWTSQEASEHGEAWGRALVAQQIDEVQLHLPADFQRGEKLATGLSLLKGLLMSSFRMIEFKSKKDTARPLKKITLVLSSDSEIDSKAILALEGIVEGMAFARTIAELPGHSGDPAEIGRRFKAEIDPKLVQLEIWDEKRIAKEKMGLLLSVARGSDIPPRFLVARYGKEYLKDRPWLALVGKGVTFDTGGINLKTGDWKSLIEMKKDMGGAAAVLGAMIAIQKLRPKAPVIAITPLTFNMIDARSTLPGDVVTSYSGKTVEIQNTDAEGRLILSDALHFATLQNPAYIVDVATLTGACMVALGAHFSGCFSNKKEFQKRALQISEKCGEPSWPLPLARRYSAELKSQIADLSNMGVSRDGGASLAACFMQNFVGQTPWVHFDIAGTVDLGAPGRSGASTYAAGRMVHTLTQMTVEHAQGKL